MVGMPWNQMMDFPVELTLHTTAEGLRLFAVPAREIASLHVGATRVEGVELPAAANPMAAAEGELLDVSAEFTMQGAAQVGLYVRGIPVLWSRGTLLCMGCSAPMGTVDGKVKLRVLVDRTSVEIFGNDGEVYMPVAVIAAEGCKGVEPFARGGKAVLKAEAQVMKSAWE